jgi:hypothetical protein
MFTRKQYNLIAKILKHKDSELLSLDAITGKDISQGIETISDIAEYFAYYVAKDFPHWKQKFLDNCKGN